MTKTQAKARVVFFIKIAFTLRLAFMYSLSFPYYNTAFSFFHSFLDKLSVQR